MGTMLATPRTAHALIIVPGIASTTIFLTSGTSWTVPRDWNISSNKIEVIGGGGGGSTARSGGGGGGYSKIFNLNITPLAAITYQIGSGGGASTDGGEDRKSVV